MAAQAPAAPADPIAAIAVGKPILEIRARYEDVDQANLAKISGVPIPPDQDGEEPEAALDAAETPAETEAPKPKKRGKGAEKE